MHHLSNESLPGFSGVVARNITGKWPTVRALNSPTGANNPYDSTPPSELDKLLLMYGLPRPAKPSRDVRGDIEAIFKDTSDLLRPYLFFKTYPSAPNPCFRLESLGRLGLPVSEMEAERAIYYGDSCSPSTGKRDYACEIDASKVRIENPMWNDFISKAATNICEALKVNKGFREPQCKLQKMILCGPRSQHFSPEIDFRTANDEFGTIFIVLQSDFTGGAVHLSHGQQRKTIALDQQSSITTSVTCWLTGVDAEFHPPESGYRLGLLYRIAHPKSYNQTSAPDVNGSLHRLRHTLLSWQQTLPTSPSKLFYLLENVYSESDLNGSSLTGKDDRIVAFLRSISAECQVKLGLASVQAYIKSGYPNEDDEDEEDGEPKPGQLLDSSMTITGLVDLQGRPLKQNLGSCDEEKETIPKQLRFLVADEGDLEEEVEEDTVSGDDPYIERWYGATVLVIWPEILDGALMSGDPDYDIRVLKVLEESQSLSPAPEEKTALNYLFTAIKPASSSRPEAFRLICQASVRWNIPSLWLKAFEAFDETSTLQCLPVATYEDAIYKFGLEVVEPTLSQAFRQVSNRIRFGYLDELAKLPASIGLREWVPEKRRYCLSNLKQLGGSEGPAILAAAENIAYIRHVIMPQVRDKNPPQGALPFVNALQAEVVKEDGLLRDEDDLSIRDVVVEELLQSMTLKLNVVPKDSLDFRTNTLSHPPTAPRLCSSETWIGVFDACLKSKDSSLVDGIINKVVKAPDRTDLILPVHMVSTLSTRSDAPNRFAGFLPLVRHTVPLVLKSRPATGYTEAQITMLAQGAMFGGLEMLKDTIAPSFRKTATKHTEYQMLARELYARKDRIKATSQAANVPLSSFITGFLRMMVSSNVLYPWNITLHGLLELLETCLAVDQSEVCEAVLVRFIDSRYINDRRIMEGTLIPVIPKIIALLDTYRMPPTHTAFTLFFRTVFGNLGRVVPVPNAVFRTTALQALRTISRDEAVLKTLLGEVYSKVCLDLQVPSINESDPTTPKLSAAPTQIHNEPSSSALQSWNIMDVRTKASRPREENEMGGRAHMPAPKRRKSSLKDVEVIDLSSP